jgi:hypothetical protein
MNTDIAKVSTGWTVRGSQMVVILASNDAAWNVTISKVWKQSY